MARKVAIGVDKFNEIVENDYFYVDKTGFLKEWWENGDKVTLITRPRRFGKTLTMSMSEQFFPSIIQTGRTCFADSGFGKMRSFENCRALIL